MLHRLGPDCLRHRVCSHTAPRRSVRARAQRHLRRRQLHLAFCGPRLAFQAHSAQLAAAFDANFANAIITFHGAWDRTNPTGYKVVIAPFETDASGSLSPLAGAGYNDLLWNENVAAATLRAASDLLT
jgi:hypothetical protein